MTPVNDTVSNALLRGLRTRWLRRVSKQNDGCWEWTGARTGAGYGKTYIAGRIFTAHRVSWVLQYGEITDSTLYVCHKCDNRLCVRPDHLFLGTARENTADMVAKGRHKHVVRQGEDNARAILSGRDVLEIRRLRKEGVKLRDLAEKFGVSIQAIWQANKGQSWRHIA